MNLTTNGAGDLQQSLAKCVSDGTTYVTAIDVRYGRTGSLRISHQLTMTTGLARGNAISPTINVNGTAPLIEYIANVIECSMSYEEIVSA